MALSSGIFLWYKVKKVESWLEGDVYAGDGELLYGEARKSAAAKEVVCALGLSGKRE